MAPTAKEEIIQNFNPRSREGSDGLQRDRQQIPRRFQSTLPRGERLPVWDFQGVLKGNFNPRSREGSDSNFI